MPCFRSALRSLTGAMFFACLSLLMTGCLFTQDTSGERCDEARRCNPGDAEVCGVDGEYYTCASYAVCLGVQLDATGAACDGGGGECPNLQCGDLGCQFGQEVDENGCDTCSCKPAPTCEPLGCRLYCEDGYKQDEDGCDLCECAGGGPVCEPVACDLYCEYGFKTGPDGCATCTCEEPPVCPAIACEDDPGFIACEEYLVDEHGCPTCECAKPVCPDYTCPPIECEYGFKTDEYGCTTCECEEPPECAPVLCNLACEYGFKQDADGCEVCECAEPPVCNGPVCDVYCPYGNVIDDNGCETCACNPAPACSRAEDCPLDNVCDFEERADCCMPDQPCTDDLPACPLTCQARQICGFGAAMCSPG
ncbi:MAG: hypothetical protein VX475_15565, partial [Myxococcota bacterium]|nr:hypothetical protein [Myxococcota bacterium]